MITARATSLNGVRLLLACARSMANASSMPTLRLSATIPLACSMTIREFERALELPGEIGPVLDGPFLEDPDGGRVGQRLGEVDVLDGELHQLGAEDVHGPDHVTCEAGAAGRAPS